MPRIPGIELNSRAVGPVGTPNAPPATFGAGTGQGLSQLGKTIQNLGFELKDAWDESRSNAALSEAQKSAMNYTEELKYGGKDAEGNPTAAPRPDEHVELYEKHIESIREKAGTQLSGRALRMFDSQFNDFATKQSFAVKKQANEMYASEAKANVDLTLEQQAKNFVEADELQKPAIQQSVEVQLGSAVRRGWITPQEAVARRSKFISDAQGGSVMKLIRQSPSMAITALEGGEFNDMPADDLQRWTTAAHNAFDREQDRIDRETERSRREQERLEKKTNDDTFKSLYEKQNKGTLTLDDVISNKNNLSDDHFKTMLDFASGRTVQTNSLIMSNLMKKAANGEDVGNESIKMAASKQLAPEDLKTLLSMSENTAGGQQRKWYNEGTTSINRILGTSLENAQPGKREAYDRALREWNDWSVAHPNPTIEESRQAAKDIITGNVVADLSNIKANQRVPKFLKEGLKGVDNKAALDRAETETIRAYYDGEIDRYEYFKQAEYINDLKDRLHKIEEAKQITGGASPVAGNK